MSMHAATLWDQLVLTHRMTQVSREAIRNKGLAPVFRDEAVQALMRQTDRLLDLLDRMSEQQMLAQIDKDQPELPMDGEAEADEPEAEAA